MDDIYGMLIVLGLLIVISQCVNKEKKLYEGLVNSNTSNNSVPVANTAPTPNNNVSANTNSNASKKGVSSARIVNNQLPQGDLYKPSSNYMAYNPGRILLADATSPYGFKVPQSMQQEYTLLKDLGLTKDGTPSQNGVPAGYARFLPTGSQFPGFDASAKGGLLESQTGKPVENARDVSNNLQRNVPSNSNVVPANINSQESNSNVPASPNASADADASADATVKGVNLYMVYATWCGHSKKALPDFEKLMNDYDGKTMNGYLLNIKKYDADQNKEVAKKYSVRGFPSYVAEITENGKPVGDVINVNTRSYDGLLNFLKNNAK